MGNHPKIFAPANNTLKTGARKIENVILDIVNAIGFVLKSLFFGLWHGLRQLRTRKTLISLLVLVAVAVVAYFFRDKFFSIPMGAAIQYALLGLCLALPFLYVLILGGRAQHLQQTYKRAFEQVGFVGKNKKVPFFISETEKDKREILYFKSMIPVTTWEQRRPELETALNKRILKIEQPKSKRLVEVTTVSIDFQLPKKILWDEERLINKDGVVIVGETALEPIKIDLNSTPHILFAGETGSGKSVILRLTLWELIEKLAVPFMFDFKGGVEFGLKYEQYGEVITDREKAIELLDLLIKENSTRLEIFRNMEVKNLAEYNERTGAQLSRIVVAIDELAEMMDKKGAEKETKEQIEKLEGQISTLARLSRATGINLLMGIQRPDANVLPGQIKNNIPVRFCGRFADKAASEIVLGNTKACELPDIKGRFMYKLGADTVEMQAYYFIDETMLQPISQVNANVLDTALMKRITRRRGTAKYTPVRQIEDKQKKKVEESAAALNFDFSNL